MYYQKLRKEWIFDFMVTTSKTSSITSITECSSNETIIIKTIIPHYGINSYHKNCMILHYHALTCLFQRLRRTRSKENIRVKSAGRDVTCVKDPGPVWLSLCGYRGERIDWVLKKKLFNFNILPVPFALSRVIHFRSIFLGITIICIIATVVLIWFVHKNRRIKVFRIASPTFLIITLIGCIIMYLEVIMTKIIIHVIYYFYALNFEVIIYEGLKETYDIVVVIEFSSSMKSIQWENISYYCWFYNSKRYNFFIYYRLII